MSNWWTDSPVVKPAATGGDWWSDSPVIKAPTPQPSEKPVAVGDDWWASSPVVQDSRPESDEEARRRVSDMRAAAGMPTVSQMQEQQTPEGIDARRQYLRNKYAYGLVAPLSGTRLTYSKKAIQEVTDPAERQWLTEEVGRIAQAGIRADKEVQRVGLRGSLRLECRESRRRVR